MNNAEFRAWDEQKKVMHHDFQYIKSGDQGNDWIVFTSDKQKLTDEPHPLQNPYFSQQLKISQFTGMLDKKGNKIFEGDIIKVVSDGEFVFNHVVEFDDESCCYEIGITHNREYTVIAMEWAKDDQYYDYEIIGNIYENEDLCIDMKTERPSINPKVNQSLLDWAVNNWKEQVQQRPLGNVHRRTLDDVWRQVIKRAGVNPESVIGPAHDDLIAKCNEA